ncbi:MAG: hypothetical protein R6V45_13115 [Oceanipulchritudo sp.]
MLLNIRFPAILWLLAILPVSVLSGQEGASASLETLDPGPFYGYWEFQEPAGDTCIVIIKRGGRLSCFWSGTRSHDIDKGDWHRLDGTLTARWESGHVEVFEKIGENAIERSSYNPGMSLDEEPVLQVRGIRVDPRVPGSLTTDRETDRSTPEEAPDPQAAPAIPMRNAYIGYWKIEQSSGLLGFGGGEPHFYLHLARNGDASVALRKWEGDQAVRGQWRIQDDRVVITWPSNRRDVLMPDSNEGYLLGTYRQKDDLSREPRRPTPADKVASSEAERYFEAGNLKRLTVVDIRGTWIPEDSSGRSEYISIEGWGNAFRYPSATGGSGTDPGKWRLLNDRVIVTWVDGSKDVLRIANPGMIRESYHSGEPVTGTPHRTIPVTRTD